jgi:hypothetical protein
MSLPQLITMLAVALMVLAATVALPGVAGF